MGRLRFRLERLPPTDAGTLRVPGVCTRIEAGGAETVSMGSVYVLRSGLLAQRGGKGPMEGMLL